MKYEIVEITKSNVNDYKRLDIVAFHWSAPGACGEHGGVVFVTKEGLIYHTNYLYEITDDELLKIFPPLSSFRPGIVGGGYFPPSWKDKYLGLGNYLVVHESIWDDFSNTAHNELKRLNEAGNGEKSILYQIWVEVVLKVLK